MKITLAFALFNVEDHVQNMLESWLYTLSGDYKYEFILVFDNPQDSSTVEASKAFEGFDEVERKFIMGEEDVDWWEIKCNNKAVEVATGDIIIFLQHDNWMYDKNWDRLLVKCFNELYCPGAIGMLAGLKFKPFKVTTTEPPYERIEIKREHKPEEFDYHYGDFPMAVYAVDGVNRPFAIRIDVLRGMGGLDNKAYPKQDWDCTDISALLLKAGYFNYYIPFDLCNTFGKATTMSDEIMVDNFQHGFPVWKDRYVNFFKKWESRVMPILEFRIP